MSSNERRGVSLWFLLVAVAVGLVLGFLVNNMKILDQERVSQQTQKMEKSIQEKDKQSVKP